MSQENELDALLEHIALKVHHTMRSLEDGVRVEVVDLDDDAKRACEMLRNLPAESAQRYAGKISHMIKDLTHFSDKLQLFRNGMEMQIDTFNSHINAHGAYQNASHLQD